MLKTLFKSLLGDAGASALERLLATELSSYVTPRVIVSWLRNSNDGIVAIPQGCPLVALSKSAAAFTGSCKIQNVNYDFQKASEAQVAAVVITALGVETHALDVKGVNLAKLSKTIDSLVKAKFEAPIAAVPPQDATEEAAFVEPVRHNHRVKRIPQIKKTIKISKSEALVKCRSCGERLIINNKFEGCVCYTELAKNVTTNLISEGFVLTLGSEWDRDAGLALAALFKYGA
jgi:hypothetical protein